MLILSLCRFSLLILLFSGLTACLPLSFIKPVSTLGISQTRMTDWYERRLSLEQFPSWQFSGRIAMQAGNDAWSATISWRQSDGRYEVEIYGPLGSSRVAVQGSQSHAELTTANGHKLVEADAQRLLEQHTGWSIPVSGLRYWLLALPQPHQPAQQLFDDTGRLLELSQSGWKIRYQSYKPVSGIDMPQKIRMQTDKLTVKLVFKNWRIAGQATL